MEIIFHFHANKTHFHKKGCAPSLILKANKTHFGVFGTRKWPIQKNITWLRAAVCKYRELAVKWKFRNSSYSVRKNPLVKRFRKSQSKFLKSFLFRENRQKVKSCPTPYSRRSKTFELDHFQCPLEERRFEETSSSLAGK